MGASLAQSLLEFTVLYLIGVAIASGSIAIARLLNIDIPGCAGFLGVSCFLMMGLLNIPLMVTIAIFCLPAAYARRALQKRTTPVFVHFLDLLTTTFLGVALGAVLLYMAGPSFRYFPRDLWGLFLGLVTTPSAFPVFCWLWHSSKTRPGIDRHLDSFDDVNLPR